MIVQPADPVVRLPDCMLWARGVDAPQAEGYATSIEAVEARKLGDYSADVLTGDWMAVVETILLSLELLLTWILLYGLDIEALAKKQSSK